MSLLLSLRRSLLPLTRSLLTNLFRLERGIMSLLLSLLRVVLHLRFTAHLEFKEKTLFGLVFCTWGLELVVWGLGSRGLKCRV
jgi:hypothetical protein